MNAACVELELVKWLYENKADVECTNAVRMMCVFEVMYGMLRV